MICYKDRAFCASDVEEHTCGRELTEEDKRKAEESGLPVCFGDYCDNQE